MFEVMAIVEPQHSPSLKRLTTAHQDDIHKSIQIAVSGEQKKRRSKLGDTICLQLVNYPEVICTR